MHISETSIEFGSQSKQKQNTKTQTNKEKKPKQNVKNKNKTKIIIHTVTYRGIVNVEKIYCDFFSCDFLHRRNTYLRYYIEHRYYININSIQSMISKNS